jgi:hypothetical protein
MSNFDFKKYLSKNPLLKENQVNNTYVVKDEEESDEYGDFYTIDQKKALDYLSQFDNEDVDAEAFIKDDEGWGEFEQYLEDVEQMSDKELENAMRQEMSYYFFSNPDSIGESKLHEEEQVDPQVDTLQQELGVKVAPASFGKDNYTIYPNSE